MRIMADMGAGMPDNPAIPIRTRYFDDRLLDMVGTGRVTQVVLVAAGMDTRAFRLGLGTEIVVFELDKPALLDLKQQRLAHARARSTCERRTVPVDLGHPWRQDLVSAGFVTGEPAVFVAEGLLGYLEEPQVHQLLDTLAHLASARSVLLADVSGRTPSGLPYVATWLARLEEAGMNRRFATDDPEGLFAAHGWQAQVVEYGQEGANFGRWPWPPIDPHDTNWPRNYLISARRSTHSRSSGTSKAG
jgi:methyltransferase (TIGR00027 family)